MFTIAIWKLTRWLTLCIEKAISFRKYSQKFKWRWYTTLRNPTQYSCLHFQQKFNCIYPLCSTNLFQPPVDIFFLKSWFWRDYFLALSKWKLRTNARLNSVQTILPSPGIRMNPTVLHPTRKFINFYFNWSGASIYVCCNRFDETCYGD